jgi:hypothetical protein
VNASPAGVRNRFVTPRSSTRASPGAAACFGRLLSIVADKVRGIVR